METIEQHRPRSRTGEEIWETTTGGRVWVEVTNEKGQPRALSAGGRAGARLRITSEDREIAQERILNPDLDPFTNGLLVRIDTDQQGDDRTKSVNALNTEQLVEVFAKTGKKFHDAVDSFNELTVRRLLAIAKDVDATNSQITYLEKAVEERWPIGGDTPTYREMMTSPQSAAR